MVRSKFFCFILGIMVSSSGFSVSAMDAATNIDCRLGCPNKSKKNNNLLTVFENGKQTHYALCEDCASVKSKDKTYIFLQECPFSQFAPSLLTHSIKYQCPNCKNLSYFHVRYYNRVSFCIGCNTCFNNENGNIIAKNQSGIFFGKR